MFIASSKFQMKTRRAKVTKDKLFKEITAELQHRRLSLLKDVADSDEDIRAITEERETELEESAQKDLITRLTSDLKARDQKTIREINIALERIAAGLYGTCEHCEDEIAINRLRVLPTTRLCIECAAALEKQKQSAAPQDSAATSERLRISQTSEGLDLDESQS